MIFLWALPAALQGLLMSVDEFYYHRKRGLGRWERLGHPVDTFFLLLPLSILCFSAPTVFMTEVYGVLAAVSCFVITKDEWVHARECDPEEQWVHSLLFVLHPCVLFGSYKLWGIAGFFLIGQWSLVICFLFYQTFYWNLIYKNDGN